MTLDTLGITCPILVLILEHFTTSVKEVFSLQLLEGGKQELNHSHNISTAFKDSINIREDLKTTSTCINHHKPM